MMAKEQKQRRKLECAGIVVNLLKQSGFAFFDLTFESRYNIALDLADDGKKNTFFPGPKLLFKHNDDRPFKLQRTEDGHWAARKHRGAWCWLKDANHGPELERKLEELWQKHVVAAIMEQQ